MLCCAWLLSHVRFFATTWTVARQVSLSMGFSRLEYWSGLPCPPPDLCIYIHTEKGMEGNVHSPCTCPGLCVSSVYPSQLWHVLQLDLPVTLKSCFGQGTNSFLRKLEILGSYNYSSPPPLPWTFVLGWVQSLCLQADKLSRPLEEIADTQTTSPKWLLAVIRRQSQGWYKYIWSEELNSPPPASRDGLSDAVSPATEKHQLIPGRDQEMAVGVIPCEAKNGSWATNLLKLRTPRGSHKRQL